MNPTPSQTTHNTLIEVLWTVVPVLILVVMAVPSFKLLYYVDRTPKPSLRIVQQAFQQVKRGVIARCPGMRLKVKAKVTFQAPRRVAASGKHAIQFKVRCDLDCDYTSGVIDLSTGKSVLAKLGLVTGGKAQTIRLPARPLDKGRYRVVVSLVAAVNPGPVSRKAGLPFIVR